MRGDAQAPKAVQVIIEDTEALKILLNKPKLTYAQDEPSTDRLERERDALLKEVHLLSYTLQQIEDGVERPALFAGRERGKHVSRLERILYA